MKLRKIILPLITVILFSIPFFWFKPGEMDIGGDSSRLYFYDPISYMKSQSLYGIITSGIGGETVSYYAIPYMLLIAGVKFLINSPTILIAIFHGISLSAAFLFVYLIVKEISQDDSKGRISYRELGAILAGLFYIFTPTLILGWDKEILTHNQIFLNPLIFYLLLLFVNRNSIKFLFTALLLSFLFAPNFSFVSAPPFFAFYPLAVVFLFFYSWLIKKKVVSIKKITIALSLFIFLHLYHIGSHVISLFSGGSQINQDVFSAQAMFNRGLSYFVGVAPSVKVSFSFMNLAQLTPLTTISYGYIIFPLLILFGFMWNKKKLYLLTAIFFLITFFFVSANITAIGFQFYKKLFDIPGFSMFRNFFGQWVFVFTFFYTLLFGQAIQTIFEKIKVKYVVGLTTIIVLLLTINAWPFINGNLLNKIHYQSKNIKIPSKLDPEYEKVLSYIHNLNDDGKFISFPLTDPGYQIILGTNGGAYQGPSTISYLTGKNDFTGYDGLIPYNDVFLTLVKNHDINGINRLFSILNIKYIFYNSDPNIYDDTFPKYPYTYVRDTMPKDQKEYKTFLENLPIHKVKDFGSKYHIYEVNNYLPHFYTADNHIYASDALTPFFVLNVNNSSRSVVYTQENISEKNADTILAATNVNPLLELVNNYHLHVHDPFISRSMDNVFYPFVLWKEKNTLKKLQNTPNDYVDYSLLFLAKRVSELSTFTETPIVHKSFQEPKLWQISKWKSYYSWEAGLFHLETQTNALIHWINTSPLPANTKITAKIKVNESVSQLELRLRRIINDSKYPDTDKVYLSKSVKDMFARIYRALDMKTLSISEVPYTIEIPKELKGEYVPYLHSEKDMPLDSPAYSIKQGNRAINSVSSDSKSSLIMFNPIEIRDTHTDVSLLYRPENIIGSTNWTGTGEIENTQDQTTFTVNDNFGGQSVFSKKIVNYQPGIQYLITFDYYTEGDDMLFQLYEKQTQNNISSAATYFKKILSSHTWKTQQSILTSSLSATNGYLQFVTLDENSRDKLHIRNLSMVQVPNNNLLFRKVVDKKVVQDLPTIQFKKINPTRYSVHVSSAVAPYALVFSEAYSDNWKLYLSENGKNYGHIVSAYFDGSVNEEKNDNTFFNLSFLYPGKPISNVAHTIGNGYANVWNITPADVNNKKDYELEVVYQPQIIFYYYLAISGITFLGLIITTIIFFLRKNEKK